MICPNCGHDNLPGSEQCGRCLQDLTQLDRPTASDRIERSMMEDPVSDLLPCEPIHVLPTATVREAMRQMIENDIGAVLIVDAEQQLLGIFSERDLMTCVAEHDDVCYDKPVAQFMTARPECVTARHTLAFALHKMDVGGYRHMPVVQEGRPVGVISVRDMLRHFTRLCP